MTDFSPAEKEKDKDKAHQAVPSALQGKSNDAGGTYQFQDKRPAQLVQAKLQRLADSSQQVQQLKAFQAIANGSLVSQRHPIEEALANEPVVQLYAKNIDSGAMGVATGKFSGKFKDSNPMLVGGRTGLHVELAFKLFNESPDADPIWLEQIVKTNSDFTGTDEERRESLKTTATDSVEADYFLDHRAAEVHPRKKKEDPQVSPEYIRYGGVAVEDNPNLQTGKKKGRENKPAKMEDTPSSGAPYAFDAQLIAKGKEGRKEVNYGTMFWGFRTVNHPLRLNEGSVYARYQSGATPTYLAAKDKFDKVYRNKGSVTSPENVKALILKYKMAKQSGNHALTGAIKTQLRGIVNFLKASELDGDNGGAFLELQLPMVHQIALDHTEDEAHAEQQANVIRQQIRDLETNSKFVEEMFLRKEFDWAKIELMPPSGLRIIRGHILEKKRRAAEHERVEIRNMVEESNMLSGLIMMGDIPPLPDLSALDIDQLLALKHQLEVHEEQGY